MSKLDAVKERKTIKTNKIQKKVYVYKTNVAKKRLTGTISAVW